MKNLSKISQIIKVFFLALVLLSASPLSAKSLVTVKKEAFSPSLSEQIPPIKNPDRLSVDPEIFSDYVCDFFLSEQYINNQITLHETIVINKPGRYCLSPDRDQTVGVNYPSPANLQVDRFVFTILSDNVFFDLRNQTLRNLTGPISSQNGQMVNLITAFKVEGVNNFRLSNGSLQTFTGHGVLATPGTRASDLHIENINFLSVSRAIEISGIDDVKIIKNNFSHTPTVHAEQVVVKIERSNGGEVMENNFTLNRRLVTLSLDSSPDYLIKDNTIFYQGQSLNQFGSLAFSFVQNDNMNFIGNRVNGTDRGAFFSNSRDAILSDNVFAHNTSTRYFENYGYRFSGMRNLLAHANTIANFPRAFMFDGINNSGNLNHNHVCGMTDIYHPQIVPSGVIVGHENSSSPTCN